MNEKPLIQIKSLTKKFSIGNQTMTAVNNLSLNIKNGESLGLAGESGCGKSTVGKCILGVHSPSSGSIIYNDQKIDNLSNHERKPLRKKMQMIFQDPYSSLNPRMKIKDIIAEPLIIHQITHDIEKKVLELLLQVGLSEDHMNRYPHEFSGGQRQRICIARALAVNPEFIVCDEPLSALDVSIQSQIIDLLKKMQKEQNLTYLFISHDLTVMENFTDRIAIMYLGHLVELGPSKTVATSPSHPYSQLLFSAIPIPDPKLARKQIHQKISIDHERDTEASGCVFAHRCPHATVKCKEAKPELKEVSSGHFVACFLLQ